MLIKHIILIIGGIIVAYCLYQIKRNNYVYQIRINWIDNEDMRYLKYSYDDMFKPNLHNWFGLRFPKDKHYK